MNELAYRINLAGASEFQGDMRASGNSVQGFSGEIARLAGGLTAVSAVTLGFKKAISEASQIQQLRTSFSVILGGATAARDRMAELVKFAAETPFQLTEVSQASRTLQTLTKGALATGGGLRLVGDLASGTGVQFQEMATHVGRLYDGLQSGRPVGEVMMRLQELGVLSGDVRAKLEAMQKEGANGADVWAAAAESLGQFNGMMQRQSEQFEGRLSTLKDNVAALFREVGEPVIDVLGREMTNASGGAERLQADARGVGNALAGVTAGAKELLPAVVLLGGLMVGRKVLGGASAWAAESRAMRTASAEARTLAAARIPLNNPPNLSPGTFGTRAFGVMTPKPGTMSFKVATMSDMDAAAAIAPLRREIGALSYEGIGIDRITMSSVAKAGIAVELATIAGKAIGAGIEEWSNQRFKAFNTSNAQHGEAVSGFMSRARNMETEEQKTQILRDVQALAASLRSMGGSGVQRANREGEAAYLETLARKIANTSVEEARAFAAAARDRAAAEAESARVMEVRAKGGAMVDKELAEQAKAADSARLDRGLSSAKSEVEKINLVEAALARIDADISAIGDVRARLNRGDEQAAKDAERLTDLTKERLSLASKLDGFRRTAADNAEKADASRAKLALETKVYRLKLAGDIAGSKAAETELRIREMSAQLLRDGVAKTEETARKMASARVGAETEASKMKEFSGVREPTADRMARVGMFVGGVASDVGRRTLAAAEKQVKLLERILKERPTGGSVIMGYA